MYEEYYKFTGKPFQLNPDPSFFYQSKGHQRAMSYLRYGIQQEQGFIIVTGDVGTGKTMLVNNLFKELAGTSVVAAKIVSTSVKESDLLRLVASRFELPFERSSKAALLRSLEDYFRGCKEEGKRVLIVVDEAQNLPRESLEELRMLSNFDFEGEPVVQSFLLGQREFRKVLRAPGLEQLRQRVLAAYHLKPLSDSEVKTYIEHRLRKVGWDGDPLIEDDGYFSVYRFTGGVPRRINTLMDRLLLSCCLDEVHSISVKHIEAVADEIEQERSGDNDEGYEEDSTANHGRSTIPDTTVETRASSNVIPPLIDNEINKIKASITTMQRGIDHLSVQLDQLTQHGKIRAADANESPIKRAAMWSLIVGLALVALGTAGVFVTKFLV